MSKHIKRRLIVNIMSDSVSDEEAVHRVLKVVRDGRISKTKRGPQYCFATTWDSGFVAYAGLSKSGTDVFYIGKE